MFNKRQKQNAITTCREALFPLIPELSPLSDDSKQAYKLWLSILEEYEYLDALYKSGSMIIFGSPAMGLSAVLKKIVEHNNHHFSQTNRLGVYVDIPQIPCRVGNIENALPDEVYRSIISIAIDQILWLLQQNVSEKAYEKSGLPELDMKLKDQLGNSIIEMPGSEIGQTLNEIMQVLKINQIKLCLNELSVLQSSSIPFVLNLLQRTFQSSRQIDLVFGAEMDEMQLITDTREGPVGIQFGHDIFLGLNLKDLLLPSTDDIPGLAVEGSIRTDFLDTCIRSHNLYPEVSSAWFQRYISEVFSESDSWKTLFHFSKGNIDLIYQLLPAILNWVRSHHKIYPENTSQVYEICRNFIVK